MIWLQQTIPRNLHDQGLCNAVMHICIRSHAFAAFEPMCVISWYFPVLFPCLCGKLIFMTSQNPVTTAWAVLNVHQLSEKPKPLIHDPDVVTKDNRLEFKQGKSRGSTFVKFPARLWPCIDIFWGNKWTAEERVGCPFGLRFLCLCDKTTGTMQESGSAPVCHQIFFLLENP